MQAGATRSITIGAFVLAIFGLLVGVAGARPGGINGYSGNPATNGGDICDACHSAGSTPTVTLSGPTSVATGSTQTYTLTVSGGQEVAGGLDVSVTDGSLAVSDPGTYLRQGEITHSEPRAVDGGGSVSWTFNWTAPGQAATVTMYGAGNSVNLADGRRGDFPNKDVLTINVTGGGVSTPGETSGGLYAPLLVDGYDPQNGRLAIRYESACETTNNNIYFGPLNQVASYGWTGADCAIGTAGTYETFALGSGSYFFVVVGNRETVEGSYGKNLQPDGTQDERLPFTGNVCGQTRELADRCD